MSLVIDENFVTVLDYLCIVVEVNSNLCIWKHVRDSVLGAVINPTSYPHLRPIWVNSNSFLFDFSCHYWVAIVLEVFITWWACKSAWWEKPRNLLFLKKVVVQNLVDRWPRKWIRYENLRNQVSCNIWDCNVLGKAITVLSYSFVGLFNIWSFKRRPSDYHRV